MIDNLLFVLFFIFFHIGLLGIFELFNVLDRIRLKRKGLVRIGTAFYERVSGDPTGLYPSSSDYGGDTMLIREDLYQELLRKDELLSKGNKQ